MPTNRRHLTSRLYVVTVDVGGEMTKHDEATMRIAMALQ